MLPYSEKLALRRVIHTGEVALLPDRLDASEIELQRARPEMVDAILAASLASSDELQRWMIWARERPTREVVLEFLKSAQTSFDEDRDWNYALVEKSTREIVGSSGMHLKDDPECPEIGYWVRTDRTGRGYATSAAKALSDAAFHYLPVNHVKIRMDQANIASASVPPKIGFILLTTEDRPLETPGHTGKGFIWVRDRVEHTASL
jgi:RimJ/RimL family protein N-acetyltransferase